jgi:hypothetical protein
MGYRIRMAPEVAGWLGQLRDTDPGTAGVVDEAVSALRDQGASLGPPNATGSTPGTPRRYANPGPGTGGTRAVQANVEECLTISG